MSHLLEWIEQKKSLLSIKKIVRSNPLFTNIIYRFNHELYFPLKYCIDHYYEDTKYFYHVIKYLLTVTKDVKLKTDIYYKKEYYHIYTYAYLHYNENYCRAYLELLHLFYVQNIPSKYFHQTKLRYVYLHIPCIKRVTHIDMILRFILTYYREEFLTLKRLINKVINSHHLEYEIWIHYIMKLFNIFALTMNHLTDENLYIQKKYIENHESDVITYVIKYYCRIFNMYQLNRFHIVQETKVQNIYDYILENGSCLLFIKLCGCRTEYLNITKQKINYLLEHLKLDELIEIITYLNNRSNFLINNEKNRFELISYIQIYFIQNDIQISQEQRVQIFGNTLLDNTKDHFITTVKNCTKFIQYFKEDKKFLSANVHELFRSYYTTGYNTTRSVSRAVKKKIAELLSDLDIDLPKELLEFYVISAKRFSIKNVKLIRQILSKVDKLDYQDKLDKKTLQKYIEKKYKSKLNSYNLLHIQNIIFHKK